MALLHNRGGCAQYGSRTASTHNQDVEKVVAPRQGHPHSQAGCALLPPQRLPRRSWARAQGVAVLWLCPKKAVPRLREGLQQLIGQPRGGFRGRRGAAGGVGRGGPRRRAVRARSGGGRLLGAVLGVRVVLVPLHMGGLQTCLACSQRGADLRRRCRVWRGRGSGSQAVAAQGAFLRPHAPKKAAHLGRTGKTLLLQAGAAPRIPPSEGPQVRGPHANS